MVNSHNNTRAQFSLTNAAYDCHVTFPVLGVVCAVNPVMTSYRQELPPTKGYPEIKWARNLPRRGPSSFMILSGSVVAMSLGFGAVVYSNRERR